MRKLALIALFMLPAFSVEAQDGQWKIDLPKGGSAIVLHYTVRAYTNQTGARQVDALLDFDTPSNQGRARVGVTGCAIGTGQVANVSSDGAPAGQVFDWALGGPRVYDDVATLICFAALRAGILSGDQPRNQPKKGLDS